MARKICKHCDTAIDNGKAVIRSVDFEQVAWHGECFLLRDQADELVDAR